MISDRALGNIVKLENYKGKGFMNFMKINLFKHSTKNRKFYLKFLLLLFNNIMCEKLIES